MDNLIAAGDMPVTIGIFIAPGHVGASIPEQLARLHGEQSGARLWRSLDELADTNEFQEFVHKEFPRQAAPLEGAWQRRDVLKLLGASLGGNSSMLDKPALPPILSWSPMKLRTNWWAN